MKRLISMILVFILILSMIPQTFATETMEPEGEATAYDASISVGESVEFTLAGTEKASVNFTPEESGNYAFYMPSGEYKFDAASGIAFEESFYLTIEYQGTRISNQMANVLEYSTAVASLEQGKTYQLCAEGYFPEGVSLTASVTLIKLEDPEYITLYSGLDSARFLKEGDGASINCAPRDGLPFIGMPINWEISDESILSVDYLWSNSISVSALAEGSTQVRATLENGATATYQVTVVKDYICGEKLTWSYLDNKLTISGSGKMTDFVGAMDSPWYGHSAIKEVVFPDAITHIGDHAFHYCGIEELSLPDSVTSVGENAFGLNPITNIGWSKNLQTIENAAFNHCDRLTEIALPDSVVSIGDAAFSHCYELKKVTLSDNLQSIGDRAFTYTAVRELVFPASITTLGDKLFQEDAKCELVFMGSAPAFSENTFQWITATVYYPKDDPTWTADIMQDYGGTITWVGVAAPGVTTPAKPYKIANVVSGVHVYWNAVDGAVKYGVWRSETGKDGTYKWIANPTVPHFTDTTAKSGKTYYYKITAMNSAGKHSDKSEALGITFVSTPDITSRENTSQGIKLGWQKITGATGYAIYRKVGSNDWARVATIQGGDTLSWLDTAVKSGNGTTYKYTIRALYGTTLSGCRSSGRTMVRLFTPTISSAAAHATKDGTAFVRWNKNARATGYEVRFLLDGKVVKTFTVTNVNTVARSFEGLTEGETYTVQVRSYFKTASAGTYYSAWSTAKTLKV